LKRVREYVGNETFCFTYGDGVTNMNIAESVAFHEKEGTLATVTAVLPPGRFGVITMKKTRITRFAEKPPGDGSRINGGFFVLSPGVFDYIEGDHTIWEREPIERLAHDGQLSAFAHDGYWQPMDHLRDKMLLDELWASGKAPWKVWE
jgi:glucose-1-phosphate cytidylyltransferase